MFDLEIHLEFSSASSRVDIALETGGGAPWVCVGIFTEGREHHFGLHTLVEDADGTFEPVRQVETLPSTDAQVCALASMTRRYAANLLKGDHSRLSPLRVLRAKAFRERNRNEAGTPTGAPPLDHRPTLPELFGEADEAEFPADVRLACVRSAVWDHGYSADEVATFLNLAPDEIQRIVDALDNVADDSLDALRALVGTGK